MKQDFSFWEQDGFTPTQEICIIGGGLTGLNTGISILQKSPETTVSIIERTWLPLGASTRNAGFACFGSPTEILSDIKSMGKKEAVQLIGRRWKGLQLMLNRIDPLQIDYDNSGGYEMISDQIWLKIANEIPLLNQMIESEIGLKDTFQKAEIPDGIEGFDHAVFNPYEGQLHPVKLVLQLQQIFKSLGGNIFTGIEVSQLEEVKDQILIHCKRAPLLKAQKVIVTTNAFAKSLLPNLLVRGARNHVLVTSPIKDLKWKGTFHVDEGYIYFRNVGNRILLGGARNSDIDNEFTTEFGENQKVKDALYAFMKKHFGIDHTISIDYSWSGIIGVGDTKTPIVSRISNRIWAGVRLSGMGVALSSLIGEELAEDILLNSERQ